MGTLLRNSMLIAVAALVCASTAVAVPRAAIVDTWVSNHPEAAYELWAWAKENPTAARTFTQWGGRYPDRAQRILAWAISHPGNDIDVFVRNSPGWQDMRTALVQHRAAAKTLLAWCRHYPGAAKSLVSASRESGGQRDSR